MSSSFTSHHEKLLLVQVKETILIFKAVHIPNKVLFEFFKLLDYVLLLCDLEQIS